MMRHPLRRRPDRKRQKRTLKEHRRFNKIARRGYLAEGGWKWESGHLVTDLSVWQTFKPGWDGRQRDTRWLSW